MEATSVCCEQSTPDNNHPHVQYGGLGQPGPIFAAHLHRQSALRTAAGLQAVLRGGSAAAAGARGEALAELRFLCRQVTTADLPPMHWNRSSHSWFGQGGQGDRVMIRCVYSAYLTERVGGLCPE